MPTGTVALLASVSTLVVVNGFSENVEVTPTGRPDTEQVTLPENGLTSVTVRVSVALDPRKADRAENEGLTVKLPPVVMVSVMVVVAGVSAPEVPVMVTMNVPTGAVALAENVSTLVVAVGLPENAEDTPLGMPEAARVTAPLNGLTSFIEIVTLQLPP